MIVEISIFLFGSICSSIPLIIWYLDKLNTKHITKIKEIKNNLEITLVELNGLHNQAVEKYRNIDARIVKLETENAARNYGRKL